MRKFFERLRPRRAGGSAAEPVGLEGGGHVAYTVDHALYGQFELVVERESTNASAKQYARGNFFNNHLVSWLLQVARPGGRVLDLGANIGTFALAASAAGFEVVAVEACPKHVDLLRRSIRRNGFTQIQVIHAAVGDRPGVVRFQPNDTWGMVAHPSMEGPTVEVPALTVEELLARVGWDRVDFLKIDIEGSEVAAVRGMGRLLSGEGAPATAYESNGVMLSLFGHSVAELRRRLEGSGYQIFRPRDGRYQPCPPTELQPEAVLDLLALKPAHQARVEAQIDPAPAGSEIIARVVGEAGSEHASYRRYIAGALAGAEPWVLADDRVRAALDRLRADPDESVRLGAGWWAA